MMADPKYTVTETYRGRPLVCERREMIRFLRGMRYYPWAPEMQAFSLQVGRTWLKMPPEVWQ